MTFSVVDLAAQAEEGPISAGHNQSPVGGGWALRSLSRAVVEKRTLRGFGAVAHPWVGLHRR